MAINFGDFDVCDGNVHRIIRAHVLSNCSVGLVRLSDETTTSSLQEGNGMGPSDEKGIEAGSNESVSFIAA